MKIGFDVSQTGPDKAGCGYLAESLISALAAAGGDHQFLLYPTFGDLYWNPDWRTTTWRHPQRRFPALLEPADHESSRLFWRCPEADFERRLGEPDIVHANNFFCPRRLNKSRLVYTLHDVLFADHPDWTTEANRVGCFEGVFGASQRADLIVAVSEHTRSHFLELFPHYPATRVRVAPLASRFTDGAVPRPPASPLLEPGRFWLSVGTLEPRKNFPRLIAAHRKLTVEAGALPLVVAGGQGWMLPELDPGPVHLLGYVDDRVLHWLYRNCFGFVLPSLGEGFGLPVLEAMSQGAAVITSNSTALPEIAAGAALLVDPLSVGSIAGAMAQLESDPGLRSRLQQAAVQRAAGYSWESTAHRVLTYYQLVMGLEKYAS